MNAGPLEGVKILDLSVFIAGPYCGTLLGDFGADIIKVEMPKVGDPLRKLGATVEGTSFFWRTISRNKETITVDLRTPRGQEIIRALCKGVDIVIENFRPGTLNKWGLDFETLRADNPGLIMVSVSGFGQNGPMKNLTSVARTAMAFGGLTQLVGEQGGKPLLPGVAAFADYLSGIYAAFGAMLALRSREASGKGQQVDLALFEPVFHMLEDHVEVFDKLSQVRGPVGADNPSAAPHNHFRTRDGAWVAIGCSADELFNRLARVMNRAELVEDPRFCTNQRRIANRQEIEGIVQAWTSEQDSGELVPVLTRAGVPASKLYTMEDIMADKHYAAREQIIRVETDDIGSMAMRGVIPKLSETPGAVKRAGGALGRDNHQVLSRVLGLTDAEIKALEVDAVI